MKCSKCDRPARSRGMCASHYQNARARFGWESTYIDAQPIREHILALKAAGIGHKRLSRLTGVSHNTIQIILTGRPERGTGPNKQVWRRTADKLMAVPIPEIPHHTVAAGVKVPALGTRRRLQALVAFGYSRSDLCRRLGIQVSNGHKLFLEDHDRVLASTARAVEALFNELQMTPGTSPRARNEGQRRGWPLPMAWDEDTIDDPSARADAGDSTPVPFTERYEELRDLGLSDQAIAARLGIQPESLARRLDRHTRKATA